MITSKVSKGIGTLRATTSEKDFLKGATKSTVSIVKSITNWGLEKRKEEEKKMIFIKIISDVLLIVFGILSFIKERKDRNKEDSFSYLVSESVKFQNYLVSIVLILIGLGLILSCF